MKRIVLCIAFTSMTILIVRGHETQNNLTTFYSGTRSYVVYLKKDDRGPVLHSLKPLIYGAYIKEHSIIIFSKENTSAHITFKQSSGVVIYSEYIRFQKEIPIKIKIPVAIQDSYSIEIIDSQNGLYSGSFQM